MSADPHTSFPTHGGKPSIYYLPFFFLLLIIKILVFMYY
jgi:hypothetical protein